MLITGRADAIDDRCRPQASSCSMSLKKRRSGIYRAVPVPPALLEALDGSSQHANANLAFGGADYLLVMSAPLTSVQWLVRAEDARLDAAAMNDPQVKRLMLVMATSYERLAAHAVCLERSGLPHEGCRRLCRSAHIWRGVPEVAG